MPIDFEILNAFGSSNQRLRDIFTAVAVDDKKRDKETKEEKKARIARAKQTDRDIDIRKKLERKIVSRVEDGMISQLKHWRIYAAVDLAWDTSIISKTTMALAMYAQGKIDLQRAVTALSSCKDGETYIKTDSKTGKVTGVDVPLFLETNFNLIRSVISRRHAAQKNKYNNLWPYYKYESRSTGLVGKLRADVLSQRVDMMVDQFDYRHHDAQVLRDAMLYGHSVDFPRCSWEVEKQLERKSFDADPKDTKPVITKEGVGWFNPHPTRVFWDNAYSLASINTDTGCNYIGFWDVVRFSEIDDNRYYFNKKTISFNNRSWGAGGIFMNYADYFNQYNYTLTSPSTIDQNPALGNDRTANVGFYSGNYRDASVIVANYFEKIVPKDYGIGEYPWPVWVRLVTASDGTVIFGEFMPSTPAAYLGINESDARQVNSSIAHDLMPYQDAMTNLLTHLLLVMQAELFKVFAIDTDTLTKDEVTKIRAALGGKMWFRDPLVIEYSLAKLEAAGIKEPREIFKVSETRLGQTITTIFEAMIKLVGLSDKLMAMSAAEQGQSEPREISATQTNLIANTTQSVYGSISDDYDEFRGAKKRIVYDSIICCSKGNVVCPVKDRYTPKTIKAAGFEPMANEEEDFTGNSKRQTVIGTKRNLVHDYIFSSRDGAERAVNTQAANTLVQLVSQLLSVPMIAQACGKEKIFELFNEIFRLSGAGVDLNLQLREGEDDSLGQDEMAQLKEMLSQMGQYLQQLAGQTQQNAQDLQATEQELQKQAEALKGNTELTTRLAKNVETATQHVDELNGKHADIDAKLLQAIPYDKTYPSIQRQWESRAGFIPHKEGEKLPAPVKNGEIKPTTKTTK